MGQLAHELHARLAARGLEPRHHKYMLKNRGVPASDPKFYRHIHPVQDLIRFLEDVNANDDPVDATIGSEFTMSVFSRRWGHPDTCHLKRTDTGWEFDHLGNSGPCDKRGSPHLFKNLDHDSINYPEALGGYLEYLWERAAEDGLTAEQTQAALTVLGDWVSACERSSPGAVWKGYK